MGGGGSTSRVVIEENEGSGLVTVTDDVARRLLGQETGPRPVSTGVGYQRPNVSPKQHIEDIEKIEHFYKDRIKALEQQNAELYQTTTEQFAKAVEEVEQKFLKTTASPICTELQEDVLKCYQDNQSQGLNCSSHVQAFSECVRKQREKLLTSKG
eukprot:GHVU01022502.1.p1 GENE.GHVU01022502.1~~GHVU01022502.1.p1  ORF type:complete len:155 (+),score=17.72 GHVU01022502.1:112-576(+)